MKDRIKIIQADITQLNVDAIVNAANSSLLGGGGVDGAIHDAAGPELLAACRPLGGCPTGEGKLTKGFNLPAKYVIHTVGPIYSRHPDDPKLLAGCYTNSLNLALENGIKTIAFPAISCGVYGYPVEDACKIAVDSTVAFLNAHERVEQVFFVVFRQSYIPIYEACLEKYL